MNFSKRTTPSLFLPPPQTWLIDHQTDLDIDATNELFSSSSPNLFSPHGHSAATNIRTGVHGQDGDLIQISIEREFKGVRVVGSKASATIKQGNLINVGFEKWGSLDSEFDVEARIGEEEAMAKLAEFSGMKLDEDVTCKPEYVVCLSLVSVVLCNHTPIANTLFIVPSSIQYIDSKSLPSLKENSHLPSPKDVLTTVFAKAVLLLETDILTNSSGKYAQSSKDKQMK